MTNKQFPKDFILGTALASYQVEGGIYNNDWTGHYEGKSKLVLKPASTKEVSEILSYCNDKKLAVVPQGGNTGLCGGSTPDNSGNSILINFTKLNNIRNIDLLGNTVTVEAGCILENVLKIVKEQDSKAKHAKKKR